MTDVQCFWIEPTNKVRLYLRRYRSSDAVDKCPGKMSYHDAIAPLFDVDDLIDEQGRINEAEPKYRPPFDDPRWPQKCECGYVFQLDDQWQVFRDRIYSNVIPLREQKPGAMFDAYWWPDKRKHADGRMLTVVLPTGEIWQIDGGSSNGNGWTRDGEPPNITARHSILTPNYHGFLTNGVLKSC